MSDKISRVALIYNISQEHCITCSFAGNVKMSSQDDSEADANLIEDACNYASTKSYPAGADKNRKRIIRRKAQRLAVKDGEVYYKKKKGEVCRLS